MTVNLYAVGPRPELLGRDVGFAEGQATEGAEVAVKDASVFEHVDAEAGSTPALLSASVDGLGSGAWVALAVDGRVAGMGPAFVGRGGDLRLDVMLDPSLLGDGGTLSAFAIADDGALRRLRVR
jgi:hypothetical protein